MRDRNLCPRCGVSKAHAPGCDGKSPNERRRQTQLAPKCACGNTATFGYADCGACREQRLEREERSSNFNQLHDEIIACTEMSDVRSLLVKIVNLILAKP